MFFMYILIFSIGSIIGSYSNMLIYRFTNVESIWMKQRSYCPKCNHHLKWYNLIPIFSYLFQNRKCTYCKEKINSNYILLEILTGLIYLLIMINVSWTVDNFVFFFVLLMFLVPLIFIDYMTHLLYDGYHKFLILLTSLFLYINQYVYHFNLSVELPSFYQGVLGFVSIYIGVILINKIGGLVIYGDYRCDLFGMGDVKILAWIYMILGSYMDLIVYFFLAAFIELILYITHQFLFYFLHMKKDNAIHLSFGIKDVISNKYKKIKIKLIKIVNPELYKNYIHNKELPFTFLVENIDDKRNIIKLRNGKLVINIEVDTETIMNMQKDKEKSKVSLLDFYISCKLKFDDNAKLISLNYNQISDYEYYLQSMLRTKSLGVEGVPFIPGLIFSFIIYLLWGADILLYLKSIFIS